MPLVTIHTTTYKEPLQARPSSPSTYHKDRHLRVGNCREAGDDWQRIWFALQSNNYSARDSQDKWRNNASNHAQRLLEDSELMSACVHQLIASMASRKQISNVLATGVALQKRSVAFESCRCAQCNIHASDGTLQSALRSQNKSSTLWPCSSPGASSPPGCQPTAASQLRIRSRSSGP
jgi:hypothetical protein